MELDFGFMTLLYDFGFIFTTLAPELCKPFACTVNFDLTWISCAIYLLFAKGACSEKEN